MDKHEVTRDKRPEPSGPKEGVIDVIKIILGQQASILEAHNRILNAFEPPCLVSDPNVQTYAEFERDLQNENVIAARLERIHE